MAGYPPWTFKQDQTMETLRRAEEEKERERQRREEERVRREREERERREKEKEEKARKEAAEREREREREQRERERERREKERREMAERERERERLMQQQRINENSKMAAAGAAQRDRSPLRNGIDPDQSRIKEEPKRDEEMMMRSASVVDPRYHQSAAAAAQHHYLLGRHPASHMIPPPHLSRAMLTHQMAGPGMPHFPPTAVGWPMDPFRDHPYRLDPMHSLRYAPSAMEAAYRAVDEERAKAMFAVHSAAHLRAKDPSPIPGPPHRMNPNSMKPSPSHMPVGPNGHPVSVDLLKKEESSLAR